MEKAANNILGIGVALLIVGLVIFPFSGLHRVIPEVLIVLGLELTVVELVRKYIFKRSSLKALGIIILLFSALNFLRHSTFLLILWNILDYFEPDLYFLIYFTLESIWLAASIWILRQGVSLAKELPNMSFAAYTHTKKYKILIVGILVLLILEIPIFGIHGDYTGGLHGHGIWTSFSHIH